MCSPVSSKFKYVWYVNLREECRKRSQTNPCPCFFHPLNVLKSNMNFGIGRSILLVQEHPLHLSYFLVFVILSVLQPSEITHVFQYLLKESGLLQVPLSGVFLLWHILCPRQSVRGLLLSLGTPNSYLQHLVVSCAIGFPRLLSPFFLSNPVMLQQLPQNDVHSWVTGHLALLVAQCCAYVERFQTLGWSS